MINPASALDGALGDLRDTPFLLDAMRSADVLAEATDRFGNDSVARLVQLIADDSDTLTAIAAIHALSRIYDDEAEFALSELLSDRRAFVREHAAWAFWSRLPRLDAVSRLIASVIAGGFAGALAQRTLQQWAASTPDHVALALEGALMGQSAAEPRARLAETLGLIPGRVAGRALSYLADDEDEAVAVRVAAMASLGDRSNERAAREVVQRLATTPGELGDVARLAAYDINLALNPPSAAEPRQSVPSRGLTVAQLFLHADIDRGLTKAGAGDNGGIATLLVRLGDSLVQQPAIDRVITMSRGSAADAMRSLPSRESELAAEPGAGPNTLAGRTDDPWTDGEIASRAGSVVAPAHVFAPIPLLAPPLSTASAWPSRVAAERGIRRALLAFGPVDVLHLRMAEVGSMAAAAVAEQLGIRVVFTLAPDPHAVIHALDMAGTLTRASFGEVDEHEHYWFRTRLVERLAGQSAHTVLFPRPELAADLHELLGIDIEAEPDRYTVVAEGIDVSVIEAALREAQAALQTDAQPAAGPQKASPEEGRYAAGHDDALDHGDALDRPDTLDRLDAFDQLDELIRSLPVNRHGLPLAISVGRLHHVKGMATIVEAWAADLVLRARCNLVIVGGDLANPSADERGQLDRIEKTLAEHPDARAGLLLAGHRPNDLVARWLAATRYGRPSLIAPRGVYVCGSLKEEFGIALLEALAAGLVVIAPNGGGPATYVADGITGFLIDTRNAAGMRRGLRDAFALSRINPVLESAAEESRVNRAQQLVREKFTIDAMASNLAEIYGRVAADASHAIIGADTGTARRATGTGTCTGTPSRTATAATTTNTRAGDARR
ncbi:glycosyltransferase [Subtercola lobariae]|uniref:Glycosyl transferase family 1 domain-containing protein n=1 Tax=Subtercola lobariae TaxID=1588641 RepID=A0A917F0T7_9MICO|nr:glycosyltransferase [Subtercola lobariae]GGF37154.1 hypothetical protein GCM10011399_32590 [Subtercola lobariae]